MNMNTTIDQIRAEEFAKSSKVKQVIATSDSVKAVQYRFLAVTDKMANLVMGLEGDRGMLDYNFRDGNVDAIEATAAHMEAKLNALDDAKLEAAIKTLEGVFGIEKAKKADVAKEAKEALGFKVK